MTAPEANRPDQAHPSHPGAPTASSVDGGPSSPIPAPRPVPSVGHWVGPMDDPARFERLDHVGGGIEGAIFRARWIGPGGRAELVALKQYLAPPDAPPDWPFDGTWRQITNQAWLLRGLPRTSHLVRVRDEFVGTSSGGGPGGSPTPYVVMEWIDGVRPDVLLRGGQVPLATRLGWLADLAEAVDLLHSVSSTNRFPLVHGDIKPGNCLVTRDRGLVLVDTGALQLADGHGTLRGLRSPPYAAPEVLAAPGRRRGTATDLYSLGAVAYFLLTKVEPPRADVADYERRAYDGLVRTYGAASGPARSSVVGHVMRLLAADPAGRARTSAVEWVRVLTDLHGTPTTTPVPSPVPHRSGRRRVVLAGVAAATVIAAAAVVPTVLDGGTPAPPATPSTSPTPDPQPSDTATWPSKTFADLPPFTAGNGPVLYEHDFATRSDDWPAGSSGGFETGYADPGYTVRLVEGGVYRALPGPAKRSGTDEVVSATGTVDSGQGAWGVWCRGSDQAGTNRYEFLLSHAGAVQITGPDGYGTGWYYLEGLDLSAPVTLSARCADVVGAPVELTLAVNGRTALTYRPTSPGVLGPGFAGLDGMTFSDVTGPTLAVTYSRFEVRRGGT